LAVWHQLPEVIAETASLRSARREIGGELKTLNRLAACLFLCACTGGCGVYSTLPGSGPDRGDVSKQSHSQIEVIQVTDAVAADVARRIRRQTLSDVLGSGEDVSYTIGRGDVLEVSVWEAPPALLFGGAGLDVRSTSASSRAAAFPEQVVSSNGTITIPFAGALQADGRTLQEIEAAVVERLKGKANQPQVSVRLVRNTSLNVTVVGEVGASQRVPLTPRGERLLDALAAAGGVRQPIQKVSVQVARGGLVAVMPLETIIQDPKQNIVLRAGDVVSAMHQPLSLTVLGAVTKNEELSFEAQGISLTQALGRIGGLIDQRADASGIFIFRFEDAESDKQRASPLARDGKVPVVYAIDLKDPASFFVAQNFPMRNKDVLYVANARANELQKFLNLVGSVIYPFDVINRIR
jgi:polysaccharide biosynthesis/export protein